jgi:hypothetical protein
LVGGGPKKDDIENTVSVKCCCANRQMTKPILESTQASTQSRCITIDNCFTKPADRPCREQIGISDLCMRAGAPKLKPIMDEGITEVFGEWLCCLIQGDISKIYESGEFLGKWCVMLRNGRFLGERSGR